MENPTINIVYADAKICLSVTLEATASQSYAEMVGDSLTELWALVSIFAKKGRNLLFVGERGTGKELLSDIYEKITEREKHNFNCAGVSEATALSTLFGHAKGSFTGADKKREGLFKVATDGLIFLDELGLDYNLVYTEYRNHAQDLVTQGKEEG